LLTTRTLQLFTINTNQFNSFKLETYLQKAGSAKANGREPKSCLGRVFNFKVGHFVMHALA